MKSGQQYVGRFFIGLAVGGIRRNTGVTRDNMGAPVFCLRPSSLTLEGA